MQGDITHIYEQCEDYLKQVAHYVYDAFGNVKELQDTEISKLNPFRYRGYYYDTETGLYYLISRYYDPEIGRFISADSIEYLDTETLGGLNLYAYCGNNPVMHTDPTGKFFLTILFSSIIIGTICGVVSGGVSAVKNGEPFWKGALLGGLKGLVLGAAFGLGGAIGTAAFIAGTSVSLGVAIASAIGVAAVSYVAGIGINYLESVIYDKPFNWGDALSYASVFAAENILNFGLGLFLGQKGYWPQDGIKYKGIMSKIVGAIKSIYYNFDMVFERTYFKNVLMLPISFILNQLWKTTRPNN